MFNAPRRSSNLNFSSSAFDPLASSSVFGANSVQDEVDPWSSEPSPRASSPPIADAERRESIESRENGNENGNAVAPGPAGLIADPPPSYLALRDSLDATSTGQISLTSLHRLLSTSQLPAATIERIINLTSHDQSSVSSQEFYCALALVGLAQQGKDVSIELLSQSLGNLPLPTLHAPRAQPSMPSWETQDTAETTMPDPEDADRERGYYTRLEHVQVDLVPVKEGWFLTKYKVESDKRPGGSVNRRYSDFVWLQDCLVKRYPFRLLPNLPPKRIGPDANFLEQRRKGLKRFINAVVNHPVIKDDGALNVFLVEPHFEAWRKRTKVSLDEESASKKLNPAQEMGIPSDLDDKLNVLKSHLPALLASHSKLVVLAERSLHRLQSAAADASRLALALSTLGEEMPQACWRSCTVCQGVGRGLCDVGEGWSKIGEAGERRSVQILLDSIEALKVQRDLYIAFRDLFVRHEKLSKDGVDALRKRAEVKMKKVETVRQAKKAGWENEVDKLVTAIDQDNAAVTALLARRVFIRASMWHELNVVLHTRQAAQATLGWRAWARDETEASKAVTEIWESVGERLKRMPIE